jgi:hypothetical protein
VGVFFVRGLLVQELFVAGLVLAELGGEPLGRVQPTGLVAGRRRGLVLLHSLSRARVSLQSLAGIKRPWRRPIFPRGCPLSIFGAGELNFRVRDGNGCGLSAGVTRISLRDDVTGKESDLQSSRHIGAAEAKTITISIAADHWSAAERGQALDH